MTDEDQRGPQMNESRDIKQLQLEIGGSFFELIEFSLTRRVMGKDLRGVYGVNVAKVREVVRMPKINPLSSRMKGIAGVFELRGIPIPAINLSVALGDEPIEVSSSQQIIVTEFSMKRAGFIVNSTHRIRRISWEKVLPPSADAGTCISGMTLIDDNEFLFILDLEKILINLEYGPQALVIPPPSVPLPRRAAPSSGRRSAVPMQQVQEDGPTILLVDDSQFIRNGVKQTLQRAGYRIIEAADGVEAFTLLEANTGGRGDNISLVVSDVEMPRMDGLSFTKKVRSHPTLGEMPIILHTSLSGKANQAAGIAVGANGYVIKNDFRTLIELMKEIVGGASVSLPA